jgi:hypothetical protein
MGLSKFASGNRGQNGSGLFFDIPELSQGGGIGRWRESWWNETA